MSDVLCNTKFLQLKSTISKSGKPWYYAHRPNADNIVVILPHTDEEILFLVEERPPIQAEDRGKYCIGFAAGLVGDERKGETTEEAIRTELKEETGFEAEEIRIVADKVAGSAGCVSEICTLALAKLKDKIPIFDPVNDGGVIADRVWVKKTEVKEWLKQKESEGYVLTAQALACLFYLDN